MCRDHRPRHSLHPAAPPGDARLRYRRRQRPRSHGDQGSPRHHLRGGPARGLGLRRSRDARLGAGRRGDHADRGRPDRPHKRREALKGIGCPRAYSSTARRCRPRSRAGMKDATDDPTRELAIARSDDEALVHLAVVGDTYTVLLSGEQTDGRFAMLDMLIPPGGGPPPHRHDFEECFRVLAGSIEVHLRDLPPLRLEPGDTANIPANAPHAFRNTADAPAGLLCTVAPAGLESFFAEFGDPVTTRTSAAPELSDVERRNRLQRAAAKASEYGIEVLAPGQD